VPILAAEVPFRAARHVPIRQRAALLREPERLLAALRPGLLARRRRHFEEESEVIAEVLTEGRLEGVFDFRDAASAARTLLTATNALLPYSLSARELGGRAELEAEATRVVEMLLGGLLSREETAGKRSGRK
jgi:hypothetical protein